MVLISKPFLIHNGIGGAFMNGAARQESETMPIDVLAMLTGAGISAGVGIVGKVLGFWKSAGITESQLQERIGVMKEEMRKTADELSRSAQGTDGAMKQTLAELRAVVVTVASLQASQDVTNKVTEKLLDSLERRSENHDRLFNEMQNMVGQVLAELRKPS